MRRQFSTRARKRSALGGGSPSADVRRSSAQLSRHPHEDRFRPRNDRTGEESDTRRSARLIRKVRRDLAERRAKREESERLLESTRERFRTLHESHNPFTGIRALRERLGSALDSPPRSARLEDDAGSVKDMLASAYRPLTWAMRGDYRTRSDYENVVQLVLGSRLFDETYYRRQIGVPESWSERKLIAHYLNEGSAAGLNPHPLFDTEYYRSVNPELAERGINPFVHFLQYGSREGRNPHPLFDIAHYNAQSARWRRRDPNPVRDYLLRTWDERLQSHRGLAHPLFVDSYALLHSSEILDSGLSPLEYFVSFGARLGSNPCPLFETAFYHQQLDLTTTPLRGVVHYLLAPREERKDPHPLFSRDHYFTQLVGGTESDLDPLVHYLTVGGSAGFLPHPLFDSRYYWEQVTRKAMPTFDGTPLEHYVEIGYAEDLNPHPLFDTHFYCRENIAIVGTTTPPLLHYLGRYRALGSHPPGPEETESAKKPHPLFDPDYYLEQNHDVGAAGIIPLVHFLECGGREGRSPHPLFDSRYYNERYRDVAEQGINPLVHYLDHGVRENRRPSEWFDPEYYKRAYPSVRRAGHNPLIHYVEHGWLDGFHPHPEFDPVFYLAAHREVYRAGWEPLEHYVRIGAAVGLKTIPDDVREYHRWYLRFGRLSRTERAEAKRWFESLADPPVISLIAEARALCTIGGEGGGAEELIRSLEHQISTRWELVLIRTRDDEPELQALPLRIDPRIITVRVGDESTVPERIRAALGHCKGQLVALVGGPAVLAPEAIALLAHARQQLPGAKLIYGDWDIVSARGIHHSPCFNTAAGPELMLGYDTISQTAWFSREALVGGALRGGSLSEVASNAALALLERSKSDRRTVCRIPRVLLHYRPGAAVPAGETSSSSSGSKFPALNELAPLPERLPAVSIVIAVHENAVETADRSVSEPESFEHTDITDTVNEILHATEYSGRLEVIVAFRGGVPSDPEERVRQRTLAALRADRCVSVVIADAHDSKATLLNRGAEGARGDFLCFVSSSARVSDPAWLLELVRHGAGAGVAAAGSRIVRENRSIVSAGVVLGRGGTAGMIESRQPDDPGPFRRFVQVRPVSAVSADALLISQSRFREAEGFDAAHLPEALHDVDLCLRVAGPNERVLAVGTSELTVREIASLSAASGNSPMARKRGERAAELFFKSRWRAQLKDDPCYHPGLSLQDIRLLAARPRWCPPWRGAQSLRAESSSVVELSRCRDPRLDIYQDLSNLERSSEVENWRGRRAMLSAPALLEPSPGSERSGSRGVTIVVLTLEKPELIVPLLETLIAARERLNERGLPVQIVIGDTGSKDPLVLAAYERHAHRIDVVTGMKYHFSRCNNALFFDRCRYDSVLFLNNDVIFERAAEAIETMEEALWADVSTAIVGTVLLYPDGRLQHGGVDFFRDGPLAPLCYHPHHNEMPNSLPERGKRYDVPAVTGACLMIRSHLFAEVGGFDEGYRAECQDIALCLASRRLGYTVKIVSCGQTLHLENATRPKGSEEWSDRRRLVRKWGGFIGALRL